MSETFTILELCMKAPVIPVLVVHDTAAAVPLAQALVDGGVPVLEVTLRTPNALDVIAAMNTVPGAIVGAGTLLSATDATAARAAGAQFGVSPGATDALIEGCRAEGLPLLPGAATASEVMALREKGFGVLKFFPAGAVGGVKALKGLYGPLPDMKFCPTGGVNPANLLEYLALPNVVCAGGSWLAPDDLVSAGKWDEIRALAEAASKR